MFGPLPNSTYPVGHKVTHPELEQEPEDEDEVLFYETWCFIVSLGLLM